MQSLMFFLTVGYYSYNFIFSYFNSVLFMTIAKHTYILFSFQGTSVRQALIACVLILFLYLTRAIYNIIAVAPVMKNSHKLPSFGYGWINVTDQVIKFLLLSVYMLNLVCHCTLIRAPLHIVSQNIIYF